MQKIDLVLEDTVYQFTYDHQERIEKIVLPNQSHLHLTYNTDNSLHTISLTGPDGEDLKETLLHAYSSDSVYVHYYYHDELIESYHWLAVPTINELPANRKTVPKSIFAKIYRMEEEKSIAMPFDSKVSCLFEKKAGGLMPSDSKSAGITIEQYLTYDGYNIVGTETYFQIQNGISARCKEEFVFDKRNNPFYDLPYILMGAIPFNKNNMVNMQGKFSIITTQASLYDISYTFLHTYNDKGYPVNTHARTTGDHDFFPKSILYEY